MTKEAATVFVDCKSTKLISAPSLINKYSIVKRQIAYRLDRTRSLLSSSTVSERLLLLLRATSRTRESLVKRMKTIKCEVVALDLLLLDTVCWVWCEVAAAAVDCSRFYISRIHSLGPTYSVSTKNKTNNLLA